MKIAEEIVEAAKQSNMKLLLAGFARSICG
jgi:hypothetical protein